jgi:acyl carrier protein
MNDIDIDIDIKKKVYDIFIDICNNPLDLDDDTDFDILMLDDLDKVEILMWLETDFDISIDEDYEDELFFENHNTINKLCKFILERIKK